MKLNSRKTADPAKTLTFIQEVLPPLEDGAYTLTAKQTVPGQTPGAFSITSTFIVQGERFAIAQSEIESLPARAFQR